MVDSQTDNHFKPAIMNTNPTIPISPKMYAHLGGFLYLISIAAGIFAEMITRSGLTVTGNAAATAQHILQHQLMFRMGFAAELFACLCNIPMAVIFYRLFGRINRDLTFMTISLMLIGTTIESVSLLNHYTPIIYLHGGSALAAIDTAQLQAWAYNSIRLFGFGWSIALVFYGFSIVCLSWLILKSTFMPRVIGILLLIEGVCYVLTSLSKFVAPEFSRQIGPYLMVAAIGEISFCLWMLIMGVNAKKWHEQQAALSGEGAIVN